MAMIWTQLLVALTLFKNVHGEDFLQPNVCIETHCLEACITFNIAVWCDHCTNTHCSSTPIKKPEECMYIGANLPERSIKMGLNKIGCKEEETISTGKDLESCLEDGQSHNPAVISYNQITKECRAMPKDTPCTDQRGLKNFHYYDCDHKCSFESTSKCVFVDDDSGDVTGNRKDGDKPKVEEWGITSVECLEECERAAKKSGAKNAGCCQWNQKGGQCRYYQNTNGKTGTIVPARNKNKWSVYLKNCV